MDLDARGRRVRAAPAAVLVPDNAPALGLVRVWLDNWSGIGPIVVGGWDVYREPEVARRVLALMAAA
jgi:hypothetical protein